MKFGDPLIFHLPQSQGKIDSLPNTLVYNQIPAKLTLQPQLYFVFGAH